MSSAAIKPGRASVRRGWTAFRPTAATFTHWLIGLAGVGLVARLIYTFTLSPPLPTISDDSFYYYSANLIANGHGYSQPFAALFHGHYVPTAAHPPLWPGVLAVFSLFTGPVDGVGQFSGVGVTVDQIVGCAFGAGVVALVGLLGRRIGDWRVGLLAAGLTALYPHVIALDGYLLSEPLYGVVIGGMLLAAYAFADRASGRRALVLGATVGLASLTRAEALLFIPVLLVPLAWRAGPQRLRLGALALAGAVLVIAPWTVRNYFAFHHFVPVSNNGGVIAGANCRAAYYVDIGSWQAACVPTPNPSPNEAVRSSRQQQQGINYAERHPARAVLVAGIRLLRIWSLYAPNDEAIGNLTFVWIGTVLYWGLLVAAAAAVVVRWRRKLSLLILVAPIIVTSLAAIFGDGLDRLRYGAEVPLLALAAWMLVVLYDRASSQRKALARAAGRVVAPSARR